MNVFHRTILAALETKHHDYTVDVKSGRILSYMNQVRQLQLLLRLTCDNIDRIEMLMATPSGLGRHSKHFTPTGSSSGEIGDLFIFDLVKYMQLKVKSRSTIGDRKHKLVRMKGSSQKDRFQNGQISV